jgi:CubicO group peptidase (beta-lactamase class C family)
MPMQRAVGIVQKWRLTGVDGEERPMKAASLVKPVLAHLALTCIGNLDEPVLGEITVRHVLTHTSGLPNWRTGDDLVPLRPPGVQWGYSGEGFVLLQRALEERAGRPIDLIAGELLFDPLGMRDSRFDEPEPGFHGARPLLTTAADYGRFLAHVLSLDDARWEPQWRIDDELAWAAGWGLELGPPVHGWQWGLDADASNFVIGCRHAGDGVVVLTDDAANGRAFYREVVARVLPGDHASLRVERNPTFLALMT